MEDAVKGFCGTIIPKIGHYCLIGGGPTFMSPSLSTQEQRLVHTERLYLVLQLILFQHHNPSTELIGRSPRGQTPANKP